MARLVIFDGSSTKTVDLTDTISVAGRAPENRIVIDDKQSSRRHFQIEKVDIGFKLVDLESRNGTRVNDRSVNQALLRPGDKIQIGKHVLTFEDPNFKEPPADVAARLGPPPAARIELPSSGPDGATLPVAQEVVKPTASLPQAPPPENYQTRRNRSGHTTAVQKNLQVEIHEERKTLTMVAVGAGVFIFVIIALIFMGGSPSGDVGTSKPQAKPLVGGLTEAERAEKEAHDFEELANFCDRNRNTPTAFNEIISRVDQFELKYPHGSHSTKTRDYKAAAANGLKTSRNAEFSDAEKLAIEDLRKSDYGNALKKVRDLLAKYKSDADIHERLVKLKEQGVDEAREYFKVKSQEAEAMKASRKDEAREAWQAILKVMGSGGVPELDDYCKIARLSLEGLQ
jgi:pSer/pThr/pTyr-binding forkhead associated (FHA) protein